MKPSLTVLGRSANFNGPVTMPSFNPAELKRALLREGFEIYRTAGRFVLLADRVRENLIMDSGVALGGVDVAGEPSSGGHPSEGHASGQAGEGAPADAPQEAALVVRVVLKAQSSEFPNEDAAQLLARARQLAAPFSERGYRETDCQTVHVQDPGNSDHTIDTWHEAYWELPVPDLARAMDELRFALDQKKTAGNGLDD